MSKEHLNVGVIGLGFMGSFHARVWAQLPNSRLLAVADHDPAVGQPLADELGCDFYADPAALLARDDIDAVSVVTPDRHHVTPRSPSRRCR